MHCTKIDATTEATLACDWSSRSLLALPLVKSSRACPAWFQLRPPGAPPSSWAPACPAFGRYAGDRAGSSLNMSNNHSPHGGNLQISPIKDDWNWKSPEYNVFLCNNTSMCSVQNKWNSECQTWTLPPNIQSAYTNNSEGMMLASCCCEWRYEAEEVSFSDAQASLALMLLSHELWLADWL